MKTLILAATVSAVVCSVAMAEQAVILISQPIEVCSAPAVFESVVKTDCIEARLPTGLVPARAVTMVTVDPKTVAAMPPLPQVDTVIREVAVAK